MRETLLFWCQHSVGLGHLVRSLALAEALGRRFDVVFLSGGPLPQGVAVPDGVEVVQLPPLGHGSDYALVSRDGGTTVEHAQELRRALLLRTLERRRPAVVLVELFPFGRKKFRAELVPLLERARRLTPRAAVVCSVRDILVGRPGSQDDHDARALALANELVDLVLVHADPHFARLSESFGPARELTMPVVHTGFVHRAAPPPGGPRRREVVVSAGGGRVGEPLLRAALAAQPELWSRDELAMRVIGGPFLPDEAWRALEAEARGREGVVLERQVDDLCGVLAGAAASVSQGGYNTTLDLLRSGVPALVVPYFEGREDEQRRRAERLAALGALRVLDAGAADGPALAAAVRGLLTFRPADACLAMDGAEVSARAVEDLLARRTAVAG